MEEYNLLKLSTQSILGFSGNVVNGLCVHPQQHHIIYPIGTNLIIQNINTKDQNFLEHSTSGAITAVAVSNNGKYVAAGFLSYPGFQAMIKVWDFYSHEEIASYESHKDKVHAIKFSKCDNFVLSLGGFVEDNNLICYSMDEEEVCCGANAANSTSGDAYVLQILTTSECVFACGGDSALRFWKFHPSRKYLEFSDILFSKYKRKINCMEANSTNTFLYCGTSSGDILKVKIKDAHADSVRLESITILGCFGKKQKRKRVDQFSDAVRYVLGVSAIQIIQNNLLLVGCGNGVIELIQEESVDRISVYDVNPNHLPSPTLPTFVKRNSCNLGSKITTLKAINEKIFITTESMEIIFLDVNHFSSIHKFISCPTDPILDITFPKNFPEIFAIASGRTIQLRSTEKHDILLLIKEDQTDSICNGIALSNDGELIISIWRNGSIKVFTPESGRLLCKHEKAHSCPITVLAITPDDTCIVTGDHSGEVHLWSINRSNPQSLFLINKFKPHRSPISTTHIDPNGTLLLTAENRGTCVLWDIKESQQKQIIYTLTKCNTVKFHPNGNEIITCGNDKQIRIWSLDGILLKEIYASKNSVNSLDISADGQFLVTGGFDLKVWRYDKGKCKLIGVAYSEEIFKVRISPDQKRIIAVCSEKRITVWKFPEGNK